MYRWNVWRKSVCNVIKQQMKGICQFQRSSLRWLQCERMRTVSVCAPFVCAVCTHFPSLNSEFSKARFFMVIQTLAMLTLQLILDVQSLDFALFVLIDGSFIDSKYFNVFDGLNWSFSQEQPFQKSITIIHFCGFSWAKSFIRLLCVLNTF